MVNDLITYIALVLIQSLLLFSNISLAFFNFDYSHKFSVRKHCVVTIPCNNFLAYFNWLWSVGL